MLGCFQKWARVNIALETSTATKKQKNAQHTKFDSFLGAARFHFVTHQVQGVCVRVCERPIYLWTFPARWTDKIADPGSQTRPHTVASSRTDKVRIRKKILNRIRKKLKPNPSHTPEYEDSPS